MEFDVEADTPITNEFPTRATKVQAAQKKRNRKDPAPPVVKKKTIRDRLRTVPRVEPQSWWWRSD
ncbi:hypothetical protein PC114_g18363 [Phytophthora cactorum]|nr:hypothetical protein PC114_g18363 [Phytophthora cactorum]